MLAQHLAPSEGHVDASRPRPVVRGTDIKVSQIAREVAVMGMTPAGVIEAHPHLTLADVHAALAHYYDHQESIHADWAASDAKIAELESL